MINEAHVSRRCLAAGGNRRMTKVKVLVMEDAAGVRRLLVSLLLENTRVGRVFEARDAATVLTLMAAHQPQIAILDITVPPAPGLRNGVDVLKLIKQVYPATGVIMLTNHASAIYKAQCLHAGADFFFDKSNEFDKLPAALDALLQYGEG